MAREPPAKASSPNRPRNIMEINEREYNMSPVSIMGRAILAMEMASLTATGREGLPLFCFWLWLWIVK
ncbi:NADH oxidase [Corchorus olitorius]|uniref:NADH oxidase n=1 Tax=Corchorus olitorius TaxID=93759 RepID=A0A1R3JSS8_9ROSI|nr:NADH oxidase [Corchorus olitorius]